MSPSFIIALCFYAILLGCNNHPNAIPHSVHIDIPSTGVFDRRSPLPCQLHKIPLVEELIPNSHLYSIEFLSAFQSAMIKEFPNFGLGLGVPDEQIKYILINYCPKCRAAHAAYEKKHAKQSVP